MKQSQTPHQTYFDPHGYFFICLPDGVYRRHLQNFGEPLTEKLIPIRGPSSHSDLLSGVLTCRLVCLTPVHVGSGSYRHESDAPGNVVADIVRGPQGAPVIPGSSLKGSFRAIAEAASKSCLSFKGAEYSEARNKLPGLGRWSCFDPPATSYWKQNLEQPLRECYGGKVEASTSPKFARCQSEDGLCPCCAIFGTLGYQGRTSFTDARIVSHITPRSKFTPPAWVTIPARNSPQPHRLADKATWADGGLDVRLSQHKIRQCSVATLVVPRPLGRKIYPNWDPHGHFRTDCYNWSELCQDFPEGQTLNGTFYQQMQQQYAGVRWPPSLYNAADFQQGEPHDVIPIGTILKFRLHFQSLLLWELGLLLFSMGVGAAWLPKVGGAKAFGLGTVRVQQPLVLNLVSNIAVYTGLSPLSAQQTAQRVNQCLKKFRSCPSYHADGIADLRVGFSLDLAGRQKDRQLHIADNSVPMSR